MLKELIMKPEIEEYKNRILNAESFPGFLKNIRKNKNWTTKDLGDYCGVSTRTIEGWEQGRSPGQAIIPLINLVLMGIENEDLET